RWHRVFEHNVSSVQLFAVELFVGLVVRTQGRAFQGNAGEQTAGPRIAQNGGSHIYVKIRLRIPAQWTLRRRSVTANFELATENRTGSSIVHHQEHEIRCLASELEPGAEAFESHHCRIRPWTVKVLATSATHVPTTITSSKTDCTFYDGGDDYHTLRLTEDFLRYAGFHTHGFFHHQRRVVKTAFLFGI